MIIMSFFAIFAKLIILKIVVSKLRPQIIVLHNAVSLPHVPIVLLTRNWQLIIIFNDNYLMCCYQQCEATYYSHTCFV